MEPVQQVHQQQLLVLLFVLQAQFDQLHELIVWWFVIEPSLQLNIHPLTPAEHFINCWSAQETPLRSRMPWPSSFVIGIEQRRPRLRHRFPPGPVRNQQEGFKKPGGMTQMPFRWAGICHPLQHKILWLKWADQLNAALTYRGQTFAEAGGHPRWGVSDHPPGDQVAGP